MITVLEIAPGTSSGAKVTLDFTIVPNCDEYPPRLMAHYEKDDVPCDEIETVSIPKVTDDGTCTFPASMSLTATIKEDNDC